MSKAIFVLLAIVCLTVNCKLSHKRPPPEIIKFDQCMISHEDESRKLG